jgi:hypothetical protein
MLDSSMLSAQADDIEAELLPALDLFASVPKQSLQRQLKTVRQVRAHISDLALERNLSFFGTPGEAVRYSSLEHQFEDDKDLGSPLVRILQSGILSLSSNGQRTVIARALVRAIS